MIVRLVIHRVSVDPSIWDGSTSEGKSAERVQALVLDSGLGKIEVIMGWFRNKRRQKKASVTIQTLAFSSVEKRDARGATHCE